MFDLLGIIQAANSDPEWLGFATEGYVVAALIFLGVLLWYVQILKKDLKRTCSA